MQSCNFFIQIIEENFEKSLGSSKQFGKYPNWISFNLTTIDKLSISDNSYVGNVEPTLLFGCSNSDDTSVKGFYASDRMENAESDDDERNSS